MEKFVINMRYFFKVFVVICTVFLIVANLNAQDTKKNTKSEIVESKKCELGDKYSKYIQIETKKFSFCIPTELKKIEEKCRDSFCKTFESEKMTLRIDADPNAGIPVLERTFPCYTEESILIDGKKVWLWHYEEDREYKYVSGANFWSEKNKYYDLAVVLFYKDSDQKETAENIIKSVRFK